MKTADSLPFLARANGTSEWMWFIFFRFLISTFINFLIVSSASVLICWIMYKKVDVNHFLHGFSMMLVKNKPVLKFVNFLFGVKFGEISIIILYRYSFPWDQTTLLGCFVEMGFTAINATMYLLTTGVFLLLFISICFYHNAFYKIFQHSVAELGRGKNDKRILCDLIQFHITTKE